MTDIEYLKKYCPKERLEEGIKRLRQGEPVQYIVGNVDFYGNPIIVTKDVLIPRFETEELVEKTIKYIQKYFNSSVNIVDIGTGSGCIAITLKKEFPSSKVSAVDISKKALEIAKKNALENNVEITFLEGNLLEPLSEKYDIIISNPPYIAYEEEIMEIVKNNEPSLALYAAHNGLACFEQILESADKVLTKRNLLAFEIGHNQGNILKTYAQAIFPQATIILEKDMQGRDRFLFILNL